jgi:hypothetical protein
VIVNTLNGNDLPALNRLPNTAHWGDVVTMLLSEGIAVPLPRPGTPGDSTDLER